MAFDAYLQVGDGSDIVGEATATGLEGKGWIAIYSFSWGASNPSTVSPGAKGLSAGRVSVSGFNLMKKTDNASNKLMTACCVGQHYPKATVVLRKATGTAGKQQIFLQYVFTDVLIESIQWSGSSGGDDEPTESLSLAFASFSNHYWMQDTATGKMAAGSSATWDITKVATS
jgi:type VI secretion system secreted protein Hcp